MLVLAVGCGRSGNRNRAQGEGASVAAVENQVREAVTIPSDSGVVKLPLTEGTGKLTVRKAERQQVYVDFPAGGYKRLYAEIVPQNDTANLRISQIVLPDGAMDGPFGRSIEYDIPSDGTVRLVIGESLMQGDPWGGDFTVEVRLNR